MIQNSSFRLVDWVDSPFWDRGQIIDCAQSRSLLLGLGLIANYGGSINCVAIYIDSPLTTQDSEISLFDAMVQKQLAYGMDDVMARLRE